MSETGYTVFLVDDDPGVLKALSRLLRANEYDVMSFASPEDFLLHHDGSVPGCAVLDVSMPGLDGLNLQQTMMAKGSLLPIIFLTGEGTIPASVRAMRAGAIDFLTKPVDETTLIEAIERAKDQNERSRQIHSEVEAIQAKLATLTKREREVMIHVVQGRINKQIAFDLGTVEKTIKVHRSRMMEKLGLRSVTDLVRLAAKIGIPK